MKQTKYEKFHLVLELCVNLYCAVLSVADPVLDLVVGLNYLSKNNTGFGIVTLILWFVPTLMLSASSLHWVIYDKAVNKIFKNNKTLLRRKGFRIPEDYTSKFCTSKRACVIANRQDRTIELEDVEIHPPEPEDQVETDTGKCRVRSQLSTDAGISKVPVILSGIIKPHTSQRLHAYEQIMTELLGRGPAKLKPSLKDVKLLELLYHFIGIPGVFRHINIIRLTYRNWKKRASLVSDYRTFVKEAEERGVKEVYFNPDLAELFHARRDAALLRLIEGAYEATPQLLLQLYIIAVHTQTDTSWFTYLSVATSFSSIVLSNTSYIYEQRLASYDKADMKIYHFILIVVIKLFMCLSRIAAFLLAATYSSYLVIGVTLVHWLACLIYLCSTTTHFYGGFLWSESFFKVICSFTLVITYINVIDGDSVTRWFIYHGFVLLQNVLMLMLWYSGLYHFNLLDWKGAVCISLVIGGMLIGTLLTILYYKFLHPTKKPLEVEQYDALLEDLVGKYESSTLTQDTSLHPQLHCNKQYQTSL